jgi:hypothetical protein
VQVATVGDFLVFISYVYVTYTMMVIKCGEVVKGMSSDIHFPIKQLAITLQMIVYSLREEYMVIRRLYVR